LVDFPDFWRKSGPHDQPHDDLNSFHTAPPCEFRNRQAGEAEWILSVLKSKPPGELMKGTGASPEVVRGPARVLFDSEDGALLHHGEILVAKFTDPAWTPLFLTAAGLIMEVGGIASHGAIVAREYGLPAIVGVQDATRILRQGEVIGLNGTMGEIVRLQEPRTQQPEAAIAIATK